jgi:hypothetical protein
MFMLFSEKHYTVILVQSRRLSFTMRGTPGAFSAFGPWIFWAALLLGVALPKPQPPSRSWAMTAPAHLPDLKPQQPEEHSESLAHSWVMNLVPAAAAGAAGAAGAAAGEAAAAGAGDAAAAPPKPQPLPPGPVATRRAAHLPTEQQPDAHSPSLAQSPVMNWVPGALPEPVAAVAAAAAGEAAAGEAAAAAAKQALAKDRAG